MMLVGVGKLRIASNLSSYCCVRRCSSNSPEPGKSDAVTSEDVEHLCQLVEGRDGGPVWTQILDRSTPTMLYQAWHRDPKVSSLDLFTGSFQ